MRNAMWLLSVWVGILAVAFGIVYWDGGGGAAPSIAAVEPSDGSYVDPDGRFSLVVPAGWIVEEGASSVRLADLPGRVEATVSVVEEPVPEAALLRAMDLEGCEGDNQRFVVEPWAPTGGAERAVRVAAEGGERGYGLGYAYGGGTVVAVIRGDPIGLVARADDLERFANGIAVPAAMGEATSPEAVPPVMEL